MKKKFLLVVFLGMLVSLLVVAVTGCSSLELNSPENLQYDGATITWNAVENADSYTVRINDGQEYTVNVPSYPYDAAGQQFNVTIKAVSNASKIVQSGETTKSFVPLGTITEIRFSNDGIPSWDPIENATGYRVKIDGVEVNAAPTPALVTTSYSEMQSGTHSFQVRAIVDGNDSYYSKWSEAKSVTILEAVAKDKITYSNGVISWNYISGARFYEVSVNGNILASECSATEYAYDSQNKDFEVTVKAIGNRISTFDAKVSEVKKFIYLNTVTNMTVEDGIVRWPEIQGADGYKVKLNGVERPDILTEPFFDQLTANITTDIEVKPVSNDTTYFSDWSVVKSVMILPSPVLQWNSEYELDGVANSNTYWNGIANATGYTVRLTYPDKTDKLSTYGATQRYFQESFLQVGTYKVEVKALAPTSGSNVYDSMYSAPIVVNRLDSPKPASDDFITSNPADVTDGFTVTFTHVTGASGYCLYRDNTEAQRSSTNQFAVRDVVDRSATDQQTYNFKVQSIGQVRTIGGQINATLSSLTSDALSFSITVLATPQNTNIDGFVYSYGAIQGNNGYVVDVQGQSFTSGNTSYDLSMLEAGVYDVSVCARGNGTTVLPSNYSAPIQVYRLEAPTNIHVETSETSEGVLGFAKVDYARGYYIVFDNDGNAIPVENMMNINRKITEQGTTVYMVSEANYFNARRTIYYMTSQPSATVNFIKLGAPTFGDVAFTNTQFMWKASYNINTQIYTPTYEVYDAAKMLYNGDKNGTTMNISNLKGGQQYTFYVKAIGNGTNFVNSEMSEPKTIWKLATPNVKRGNGTYEWDPIPSATNYTVFVGGVLAATYQYGEQKYSFTPKFDRLDTYQVDIYAIGDGGYKSIDSDAMHIEQNTKQLDTPDFTFEYTEDHYTLNGQIKVTITTSSPHATGYSYTVGGVTQISTDFTYYHTPNSVGSFAIRVYALGGTFDADGSYYIDSQSRGGGSSHTITLLATPNKNSITISRDGRLEWAAINSAIGYEVEIAVDNGEYEKPIFISNASTYTIPDFASKYNGKHIKVRIRAIGNNTTIISSETVEQTWN